MTRSKSLAFAMIGALTMVGPALAGDLRSQFSACVNKYANPHKSVSVTLQCNAAAGKLSDCKMVDGPTPTEGFDQAAICVAGSLPIGDLTGTQKVPIKFVGI